jgi:fructose-bisphosphate aldolase class II
VIARHLGAASGDGRHQRLDHRPVQDGTRLAGRFEARQRGERFRPDLLRELQDGVAAKSGKENPFDFVFHGGSGSTEEEIRTALENGVVKMNIDTDTQYAFTRPVADHMFKNYDGVLKVDGEVGSKKTYDPRTWGKLAEASMSKRVLEACGHLRSTGTKIK